jgi:Tol biopolymer transport system component
MSRPFRHAAAAALFLHAPVGAQSLEILSHAPADLFGVQATGPATTAPEGLSADGSRVVFATSASNLVANDSNGASDVFLYDASTQQLRRVSVAADGAQANGSSSGPVLSGNGTFVAFQSGATNLVPGDANGLTDVFVVELATGAVERISAPALPGYPAQATCAPILSDDARYVLLRSGVPANVPCAFGHVWLHDRTTGEAALVTNPSGEPPVPAVLGAHALSGDGRHVVYQFPESGSGQIYVYDADAGTRTLVSARPDGQPSTGVSNFPSVSADGSRVAFASSASDLVPGATNPGRIHVFLRDLAAGTTRLVTKNATGEAADSSTYNATISRDGTTVVFASLASNLGAPVETVLRYDVAGDALSPTPLRARAATAQREDRPLVSADGATIAAGTDYALAADDTNGFHDVYVHRASTGVTRVNLSTEGPHALPGFGERTHISADGQRVTFYGSRTSPGPAGAWLVHDRALGTTAAAGVTLYGSVLDVSADGRRFLTTYSPPGTIDFGNPPGTTYAALATTTVGSTVPALFGAPDGDVRSGALSGTGDQLVFVSNSATFAPGAPAGTSQVYVRVVADPTGVQELASRSGAAPGNANSDRPAISADGRYVAYQSAATNLDPADDNAFDDIYLFDRELDTTVRVSRALGGAAANGPSRDAKVAKDGRRVVFVSSADNLVPGDTNGLDDVFVFDRASGSIVRTSVDSFGAEADQPSEAPEIARNGRYVVFRSRAGNLVPGFTGGALQVYRHDLATGTTELVSADALGTTGDADSTHARVSANGEFVAFQSLASNWALQGLNGASSDAFVKRLATDEMFDDAFE